MAGVRPLALCKSIGELTKWLARSSSPFLYEEIPKHQSKYDNDCHNSDKWPSCLELVPRSHSH